MNSSLVKWLLRGSNLATSNLATILYVFAAIATIVGGFLAFGSRDVENHTTYSINQRGGITAETVTIHANSSRKLDEEYIKFLNSNLPKRETIRVASALGDAEAFQFASEIYDYLKNSGWKLTTRASVFFNPPVSDLEIKKVDDVLEVRVGHFPKP